MGVTRGSRVARVIRMLRRVASRTLAVIHKGKVNHIEELASDTAGSGNPLRSLPRWATAAGQGFELGLLRFRAAPAKEVDKCQAR